MIRYRFLKNEKNMRYYDFWSKENDKGLIRVDFVARKYEVIKRPKLIDVPLYDFLDAMVRRYNNNTLEDEGLIAWY